MYVKPEILPPTSIACQQHSLKFYSNILKWKGPIEVINVHDYGWQVRNSILKPVYTDKGAAPQSILEMVRYECKSGCEITVCSCRKLGIECNQMCKNCRIGCINLGKPDFEAE